MLRSLPRVGHSIKFSEILRGFLSRSVESRSLDERLPDREPFYVSSGTAALTIALKAAKLTSRKRQVILPAYTCPSVFSAVVKSGLEPVLCDMKRRSFQIDQEQMESKIGADTLAIVAVHLYGIPEEIIALKELAGVHDVILMEDAAQGFKNRVGEDALGGGSNLGLTKGGYLGSFGDLAILSFGRGKPLSLLHGGAVIVNNAGLKEKVKMICRSVKPQIDGTLIYLLMLLAYSTFFHPRLYWLPQALPWLRLGETHFDLDFNVARMNESALALGNIVSGRFEEIREIRMRLAKLYRAGLEPMSRYFDFLPEASNEGVALLRFPIIFKEKANRDRVLKKLKAQGLGGSESYPAPVSEIDEAPRYVEPKEGYPMAKAISERILTLPLHEYVTEKDIDKIVEIMEKF